MDLPVEIETYILSFFSVVELAKVIPVSKLWRDIIHRLIEQKVNEIDPKILVAMVRHASPLITNIKSKLTPKLMTYLCAFYAYLGDINGFNECFESGRVLDAGLYKIACYAIYGSGTRFVEKLNLEISIGGLSEYIFGNPEPRINMKRICDKLDRLLKKNKYGNIVTDFISEHKEDYIKYESIASMAIIYNRMDILKIIEQIGYNFTKTKTRRKYICSYVKVFEMDDLFRLAVENGRIEIFKWLLNIGKPYDDYYLMRRAISIGGLELLKSIVNVFHEKNPNMNISPEVFVAAIASGHKEIAIWIMDNNYLNIDQLKRYIPRECYLKTMMQQDNIDNIKWLIDLVPEWANRIAKYAAQVKMIDLIKYLDAKEMISEWKLILLYATEEGHLNILLYVAQTHPKEITEHWNFLIKYAVLNDRKKIVQWLISIWNEQINIKYRHIRQTTLIRKKICYMDGNIRNYVKTNVESIYFYQSFYEENRK